MRVLMTSTRGAGHVGPLVPFAQAFRRAGADVLVAAPRAAAATVRAEGLPLWAFDAPGEAERDAIFASMLEMTPEERTRRVAATDELLAEFGLAADPHGLASRSAPYLTLFPESLDDPVASAPPAWRYREIRTRALRPLGDWWPGDERPLVYLSFGSVAPTMDVFPSLYHAAIDALAVLPMRVLVTVGRDRDPSELGPLPPNVHVESWIPQADVMPHATAMVCHGGSGTVRMGLAAGVPMAVLPMFADQPWNAERVAQLGAGIAIEDARQAGDAVRVLLDDDSYGASAARVAAEIRALPPVDAAVDAVRGMLVRSVAA
jgi:UDP:flavonoid glycosyltransferase YjiC (YdhE family)